ncbi:MAG: hypothetical protein ACYDC3_16875, partial [Candidatus Binataceae bacterium]
MSFERAKKIADAVLYEGYVLYPYRASSSKNRLRFQFGVLAPRRWSEAGGCEQWWMSTECIVEPRRDARVRGKVRFLQLQHRSVEEAAGDSFRAVDSIEIDGKLFTSWDEGVEREATFEISIERAVPEREISFEFSAASTVEPITDSRGAAAARIVRKMHALRGVIRTAALAVNDRLVKLAVRVENQTPWPVTDSPRDEALRGSFIGAHTLLAISNGDFVSLTDPPGHASAAAAQYSNIRTWPVLVGEHGARDMILSSPIILQDYPAIAAESPGDLFDATEIDEILTLRTMTLTDEEKREARSTDDRAAAIVDRADAMPPEMLDKLHGSLRSFDAPASAVAPNAPWWDPGADSSVSPETDSIEVNSIAVRKGCRVRLCPGARRADAQDMFLEGRIGMVQGIYLDVDDRNYIAVTLEDDPGADLYQAQGRFL